MTAGLSTLHALLPSHARSLASPRVRGSRRLANTLASILLALLLLPAAARADQADYDEVSRLLRANNPPAALAKAETYLKANPRDPQMLFLRGVALQDGGRSAEALAAYTTLTQSYPELAEPYNNLAVLQAAQGRLDEALALLQQALRVRPNYAAAWDNLGDIHARLAQKAWQEAQSADATLRARSTAKQARVSEALAPPLPPAAARPALPASAVPSAATAASTPATR